MPLPNQPANTPIPPALDRWNWGAFFLNFIWGLGNSTYIALLMFVPFVNIIMLFVLGAKGSKWAWKNRLWADEAHFIRTQRNWARAGLAIILSVPLLFGGCFYSIYSGVKNSEAATLTMAALNDDARVVAMLGDNIEIDGFISGNISLNGTGGTADLSMPVSGSKCNGRVESRSTKLAGQWAFSLLVVRSMCGRSNGEKTIVLINKNNLPIPMGPDAGQQDV